MPEQNLEALYPGLTGSGRLAAALQSSLRAVGSGLEVQDPLGAAYANVRAGNRSCQVMVASDERSFGADFWDRGVQYGHLWSHDLNNVANALERFLVLRSSTDDLRRLYPLITVPDAARAHEEGRLVDHAWSQYLSAKARMWPEVRLREVFALAGRTRLRPLMPFTSHNRACFSSRTGFPYTRDCPIIEVSRTDECYVFSPASGDGLPHIFSGSIADAVAYAEAILSPSVTNAIDGTADDDAA